MKYFLHTIFVMLIGMCTYAQNQNSTFRSPHVFGIKFGVSNPLGDYQGDIGRAKIGIYGGLDYGYFFKNRQWGFLLDARYVRHNVRPLDATMGGQFVYEFTDGFSRLQQDASPYFQHIGIAAGPVYRWGYSDKLSGSFFVLGGVLFQEYHEFQQSIHVLNPFTANYEMVKKPYFSNHIDKSPTAGMAVLGSKILFAFNPVLSLGLQIDYMSALGNNGYYRVGQYESLENIDKVEFWKEPQGSDIQNNIDKYFSTQLTEKKARIQSMQAAIVLQMNLGRNPIDPKKEQSNQGGQVKIIVKDKITQQLMPEVSVELLAADGQKIQGKTNQDGILFTDAPPKAYIITGKYNDLNTSNETLTPAEFDQNSVEKILYYDDERFILKGQTVDCESGKPLGNIATQLVNIQNGKNYFATSDSLGNFYYRLDQQSDFHITAHQNSKFSQTEMVTTKGISRSNTLFITLKLGVCEIEEGSLFEIKNILYDFDQYNIRPDAALVLNNLVNMMTLNPTMTIELSSHTDSRGSNAYNQELSQKRAESAVQYLINKGVQRNRLRAKGYGESKLKNQCKDGVECSDEEHQMNRRTEITIIKK